MHNTHMTKGIGTTEMAAIRKKIEPVVQPICRLNGYRNEKITDAKTDITI